MIIIINAVQVLFFSYQHIDEMEFVICNLLYNNRELFKYCATKNDLF